MTPISKGFLTLVLLSLLVTAGCAPAVPEPAPTEPGGASPEPAGPIVAISDRPRDLSPAADPDDLAALADANAAFAFDLYHVLAADEGNLFFSPYSISVALAMTYAGAAGDTAEQMAGTLHFTLPPDQLHAAFNAYSLDLQARAEAEVEGTPFELSIANSLWGQQGFPFLPEFLDVLGENAARDAPGRLRRRSGSRPAGDQPVVSDETRRRYGISSAGDHAMARLCAG
jgi:serpin B